MNELYNIQQHYLQILEEVEEMEGELTPELEEKLTINENLLANTCVQYKDMMSILESNVEMADKEIERINKFKKVKQKAFDTFKHALLQALLLYGEEDKKGIKRLEFETLKLSTRKSQFIDIFDEESIDKRFIKIDISNLTNEQYTSLVDQFPELSGTGKSKISKTDIKDNIKNGVEVNGAILSTKYSLTIK